ncbi:phage tail spike protein [Leuconostoc pseudomesenteroides]|uniref:phage tail spike protein n=1 Tax=Leuconostoc pseudomesenteroides TaxID=33968 RepID=UPI00403DF34F
MTPIIFESGTQNFDSLGLGLLPDATKALVTEQLNGQFTFDMNYPVDGRNYSLLKIDRIIKVDAGHKLLGQAFVIKQITQNIDMTVSVYAEHISYLSLDMTLKPMQGHTNLTAQQALQAWKDQMIDTTPFIVYSDITTQNQATFGAPDFENARQALGGHEGSILDVWGGEYEFDNWYIRLWKQRGKVANTIISYGRNLIDLSQETDITNTYTSLYPYMVDNNQVKHFLPELVVDSEYVGNYPNRKPQLVDFSSEFGETPTYSESKLRSLATQYIKSNNVGVPTVSFEIKTIDISKVVDYQGDPEQLDLADTVSVYFEKLNINATAQVTEVVWNVLSEQYDSFKLGARRASLSSQIADVANTANSVAQQAKDTANNAYQVSANGKHIVGYLNSGDPMPDNPKIGDTIFMKDGDDDLILEWDGTTWVTRVDPHLTERLQENLTEASVNAQNIVDSNNSVIRAEIQTVAVQKAQDEITKGNFDAKAQGYANAAKSAAISQAQALVNVASSDWTNQLADATTDYTKKYKEVKDTADGVSASFNSYKKSNDDALVSYKYLIDANSKSIALAATKTELNTAKSEFSSQVASVQADYKSVTQSVTELTGKFNDLGQINQLFNTEWSPDFSGWGDTKGGFVAPDTNKYVNLAGTYNGSNAILFDNTAETSQYYSIHRQLIPVSGVSVISLSWATNTIARPNYSNLWIRFFDSSKTKISETSSEWGGTIGSGWTVKYRNNLSVPDGTAFILVSFEAREGTKQYLSQPLMVFSSKAGSYVQGNYNSNDKIALQQITIDSISNIVSNPTTGLSTRVQTAEGFLTQVRGTDIPALQKATFWQSYSSLDFNDYTDQGSFFFNISATKPNGPTTSKNYVYLIVEQGLPTSSGVGGRIKQTAWYDGTDGVKTSYVRTLNNKTWSPWYANDNDSVATISVMNGQIEQEVSDRKSGDDNTLTQSKSYTQSQISSATTGLNTTITQTANGLMAMTSTTNLIVDSSLINKIDEYGQTGLKNWYYSSGVSYQGVQAVGYNQSSLNGGYSYFRSQIWDRGRFNSATIYASVDVKINRMGTASTDNLDIKLAEYDANMNLVTTTSITGVLSVTNNKWVQYKKQIVVNSSSKFFVLSYNMQGNGQLYIARPYVGLLELPDGGYIAGPTSSNSTILSLFKDNWSIGIADNIGNIVSGIAGNSSQMAIISDKVIIKSPNTQITGTAWIKTAMIANGAVGTAQIGDASITSAKILSLDVNKLSGNTSAFIRSTWDGYYGSTTITSDGMVIGTFAQNGYDTTFDKSGITFTTREARYGFAEAHYGTDSITNSSGVLAHGMEIRFGNKDNVGFDYFAIKSPGPNNLEFGTTTNAGHISLAITKDDSLMPILSKGINIFDKVSFRDDISVGTINGAQFDNFTVLRGKKIYIPSGMNSNGTASGWYTIQL